MFVIKGEELPLRFQLMYHILAMKLHDSEQQLGNHMKLNKPSILQNKSPCTDPYFLTPKQTTEKKEKSFSLQIVRKFTSHASQWKWIFGGQRSYLAFPGA